MKSLPPPLALILSSLLAWVSMAVVSAAEEANALTKPAALHALILSGGGAHDWQTTTAFLRQQMTASGRFDVRVCESPAGITAETLAPFDVIVDDYQGPRLGSATEAALEAFINSGKGLVLTRNALLKPGNRGANVETWPGLGELAQVSWTPTGADSAFRVFPLKFTNPDHPIMRGLKEGMHTGDQLPSGFTLEKGAELVAASDQGEPLASVSSHGKGRIFCTLLGHDLGCMQEKAYLTTFLRGTEWAASGSVTLPAEIGMPNPHAEVRILVITGGHDHETSFYGLFDGYNDLGWVPVNTSAMAFKQDIRDKYDVLVMYDFTRDLEENERKNLRDFVESNKGVVILHHGILNYQKWPWWYEEVAGGRYRLERDGDFPGSSVKFGEEHLITPVPGHPITAGIGPFHVTDETYRGMFISPKITPLLTTNNRTSDSVVGWIGPCTTSRVVFIQLGHDHSPFRHPSYRALVHNSILWTAGKL